MRGSPNRPNSVIFCKHTTLNIVQPYLDWRVTITSIELKQASEKLWLPRVICMIEAGVMPCLCGRQSRTSSVLLALPSPPNSVECQNTKGQIWAIEILWKGLKHAQRFYHQPLGAKHLTVDSVVTLHGCIRLHWNQAPLPWLTFCHLGSINCWPKTIMSMQCFKVNTQTQRTEDTRRHLCESPWKLSR